MSSYCLHCSVELGKLHGEQPRIGRCFEAVAIEQAFEVYSMHAAAVGEALDGLRTLLAVKSVKEFVQRKSRTYQ